MVDEISIQSKFWYSRENLNTQIVHNLLFTLPPLLRPILFLDELMALAFTHFSWWLWSGKHQEPKISKGSSLNPPSDSSTWEFDALKFPFSNGTSSASLESKRVKRRWHSREEENQIDREHDIVLVPSDGGCVSGFDSDSDWSIGWLEPHGPEFQSDDEDNSFAVLVPCYGSGLKKMVQGVENNILTTVGNIPDLYSAGSKKCMEEWLSSLQNC